MSGRSLRRALASIPTYLCRMPVWRAFRARIFLAIVLAAQPFPAWRSAHSASALLLTPVIVLWAVSGPGVFDRKGLTITAMLLAAASAVGLIVFTPFAAVAVNRAPMGFLAMVPLLWAALRRGQRDTATVALVLACFAIWGAAAGGPFARSSIYYLHLLNDVFMLVPDGFVTLQDPARRDPRQSGILLALAIRRNEAAGRLANHLLTAVAEQALCGFIPGCDRSIQCRAYDGIGGGSNDGGKPGHGFLRLLSGVQSKTQPLLAFAQPLLGLPPQCHRALSRMRQAIASRTRIETCPFAPARSSLKGERMATKPRRIFGAASPITAKARWP